MKMPRLLIFLVVKTFIVEEIFGKLYVSLRPLCRLEFKNKGIAVFKVNERRDIIGNFSAPI